MITYIDTDELETISKELMKAADDLDREFNTLFKRLANVPTVTKEWVGTQADKYFKWVALEKMQYNNFADSLRSIGKELGAEASDADLCIKDNNKGDNMEGER